jgi:hypothetical protein
LKRKLNLKAKGRNAFRLFYLPSVIARNEASLPNPPRRRGLKNYFYLILFLSLPEGGDCDKPSVYRPKLPASAVSGSTGRALALTFIESGAAGEFSFWFFFFSGKRKRTSTGLVKPQANPNEKQNVNEAQASLVS